MAGQGTRPGSGQGAGGAARGGYPPGGYRRDGVPDGASGDYGHYRDDYQRPDYQRGDYARGDYPRGDYPRGDYPPAEFDRNGHPPDRYTRDGYPRERTPPRPARRHRRRDTTGGAEGNERLTGATGAILLGLFAAEGVTILSIHQLITIHFFLGMLLVGPVVLKICSTVYRFTRYYTGAPDYRRMGPPAPLLRLLGPFVLITSLTVIGSGIMLAVAGPGSGPWLLLHKASFVLWFGVMTIHVLAYAWRLPRLIGGDLGRQTRDRATSVLAGRPARWLLLTASILGGLAIALATVHLAGAWTGFQNFG